MRVKPLWRVLAGVETGVVAGAVMLAYLMLDAALRGAGMWTVVNLFASNSYGAAALGSAFRRTTLAGLAWHIGASGVLGLAISLALGPLAARPLRCALAGASLALIWYYCVVRLLWPLWNPLGRYHPFPGLLFGYLVFGVAMGSYPKFLAELGEFELSAGRMGPHGQMEGSSSDYPR
jgi:hypothetical protein